MNEDLKEKKRQDKIKAEMLSHRKAGHRVDKVKKMQRLSKSISTEKKTMAKNALVNTIVIKAVGSMLQN